MRVRDGDAKVLALIDGETVSLRVKDAVTLPLREGETEPVSDRDGEVVTDAVCEGEKLCRCRRKVKEGAQTGEAGAEIPKY